MYRIISGVWRGKKISAPKNFEVRPTTDFAKEALFSILEHRVDMRSISVLDLFAGIGSISFEFASRGCRDITSVDMQPKHAGFISSTAKDLGFDIQINVQRANVFDWLKKSRNNGKTYDIIFADPPFDLSENEYKELITLVLSEELLKENGIFILEHQSRYRVEHEYLQEARKYGNVSFSFFRLPTKKD